MRLLIPGDQSGRPDTSRVDRDLAESYALRMFEAVMFVRLSECRTLHCELNADWPLYSLSLDMFRGICNQRGLKRGCERFKEYAHD